jgi:hypothetical protein
MNCFDNNFVLSELRVTKYNLYSHSTQCDCPIWCDCHIVSDCPTHQELSDIELFFISCWQPQIYLIRVIFDFRILTSNNSSVKAGTSGASCSAWKQRRFGCKAARICIAVLFILSSLLGKSPDLFMQYIYIYIYIYIYHIPDTLQCSFGNFHICSRHCYCRTRKTLILQQSLGNSTRRTTESRRWNCVQTDININVNKCKVKNWK